jgi:hypothetical protein
VPQNGVLCAVMCEGEPGETDAVDSGRGEESTGPQGDQDRSDRIRYLRPDHPVPGTLSL